MVFYWWFKVVIIYLYMDDTRKSIIAEVFWAAFKVCRWWVQRGAAWANTDKESIGEHSMLGRRKQCCECGWSSGCEWCLGKNWSYLKLLDNTQISSLFLQSQWCDKWRQKTYEKEMFYSKKLPFVRFNSSVFPYTHIRTLFLEAEANSGQDYPGILLILVALS